MSLALCSARSGTVSRWTRCGHPIGFAMCSSTAATTTSMASCEPDLSGRMMRRGSYHHADRMFNAELALYGRFQLVPDWLYFRREHAGQPPQTVRDRCATFEPRRADRLRHPAVRLYGEYLWAYIRAIKQAPLSVTDQLGCYGHFAHWMASRTVPVAGRSLRREPLQRGSALGRALHPDRRHRGRAGQEVCMIEFDQAGVISHGLDGSATPVAQPRQWSPRGDWLR